MLLPTYVWLSAGHTKCPRWP